MQVKLTDAEIKILLDALRERVIKLCYSNLNDTDKANDAAQDTLMRAWEHRHTFQQKSPFEHWVMRIATNVCLDLLRKSSKLRTSEYDDSNLSHLNGANKPHSQIENCVLLDQILPMLRECMGDQNFWIWQQSIAGLSAKKIAEQLLPIWKLSAHGVHSRFERKIKPCIEKAKQFHRYN